MIFLKRLLNILFIPCIFLRYVQAEEIVNFFYNSKLKGFRLNTTVLMEKVVYQQIDCVMECSFESCCRSINYKKTTSFHNEPNCEMLHNMAYNTSENLLEKISSYDHVYLETPEKEYNVSCFPKLSENDLQGTAGFFVKHVKTGMCINVTSILQDNLYWGNLTFVELSNNCLDPAARSRFLDNSAMFNLKRKGCLEATRRWANARYNPPMLYLLLTSNPADNCRTDHAIHQTSWGGLSVYYDSKTWCAVPKTDDRLAAKPGIDPYIGLTNCNDAEDKRFHFGSVTCHGNMVKNVNCPKDQYMLVKNASYRGLLATKTCGLSDDYSCEVNVTCIVKKRCDGQHECKITVDNNLFSGDLCPGLTKYLYFEYQCAHTATYFNELCGMFIV